MLAVTPQHGCPFVAEKAENEREKVLQLTFQ